MTSLQIKRFSEQTRTAGNGDINNTTSKARQAIEKPLIHHGFITPFVSGTSALTTTEHKSGLIHVPATPFGPFIGIPAENTKAWLRDWQTILPGVIHRRRTRKLICNSWENPSER